MEVTRKNFKEALPLVVESIDKADFLVIDTEFTGLINGRDVSMFDSPQEYYSTLLHGSTDFLLIQYGLCAFYWNDKEKHYMNDAYNFYLFPRGRPGLEKTFLCQSSSLDFLASQGFDFNKLIKEGISYMTEPTESKLRENLAEKQSRSNNEKDTITIPPENKPQIEAICQDVRTFLDENKSDEMEIDRCNGFIRRLLFQELGLRFKDEAFVETKVLENKDRVLKVTRIKSANDSKSKDAKRKEKEWEEFEEAVGFSRVARMISQSEKLVIGHNMLLDLLHTLTHFFQPLPSDYASFKEFAHCMFPRLLDTKYMSSLPPFKDKVNSSVLPHLLHTLSQPPFALPTAVSQPGRGYSCSEAKAHEAGYDAYVTGLCFLAMHAHLSRMRGEPPQRVAPGDSALLKPFINKLFLAKTAHQDSPYINLTGDDPSPSRDHVFHLTFPKEWRWNDINQLFSAFGQITVQFLDDTSALVALSRKDLAKSVTRAFANNSRISLVPYVKYKMCAAKPSNQYQLERREDLSERYTKIYSPDNAALVRRGTVSESNEGWSSKKKRGRSNSVSLVPPALQRTTSGEFQVDDFEPPAKKTVLTKSNEDSRPTVISKSNGRSKNSGSKKEVIDNRTDKDKMIDRFESDSKSTCVAVFRESCGWD
ncbi:unnamed protein product, partial [Brenthis ino]